MSPWVLGFADEDPVWSPVIAGGAVAALAFIRAAGALYASSLSWVNALIGVWIFTTAFWLYDTAAGDWNSLLTGAAVIALALWSAAATESRPPADERAGGDAVARYPSIGRAGADRRQGLDSR